jgi:hypothetical protein
MEDDKTTQYFSAFVDLDEDDRQAVVVYVTGRYWCGSGRRRMLVLAPKGSSYAVVTETTITRLPIRVLTMKSNGWHDIGVWVQGGGVQPAYEAALSFDGKTYPSNPSSLPARPFDGKMTGEVVVPRTAPAQEGALLYQ